MFNQLSMTFVHDHHTHLPKSWSKDFWVIVLLHYRGPQAGFYLSSAWRRKDEKNTFSLPWFCSISFNIGSSAEKRDLFFHQKNPK